MLNTTNSVLRNILEWVAVIAIALVVTLGLRTFVVEPFTVPTSSMEPTIQVNDMILAQKVTLEMGQEVEIGDIVIFKNPEASSDHEILVKRVIAKGGQTVDIKDGDVYVDGAKLNESYAQGSSYELASQAEGIEVSFPYTVPEGSIWVMGDNRENSADSRYFGAVSEDNLVAVAMLRYWPFDRFGTL